MSEYDGLHNRTELRPASAAPRPALFTAEPDRAETEAETHEIFRLLERIPARSSLYAAALSRLKSRPEFTERADTTELLLQMLATAEDDLWRERVVSAWALGQSQPQDAAAKARVVESLCAVLENRTPTPAALTRRRLKRGTGRALLISSLLAGLSMGLFIMLAGLTSLLLMRWLLGSVILTALFLLLFGPVITPAAMALDARRGNRVRAAAARALGKMGDPMSIGALAGATLDGSRNVWEAAQRSLWAVLPTLTPEHYGQLGAQAVPNLCRVLSHRNSILSRDGIHSPQYSGQVRQVSAEMLALLDALEKVGDGRAVECVEKIAFRPGASGPWEVREAAERALPVLQERRRQEEASGMLLRGTSAPDAAPEELLRAAAPGSAGTAPELLLRPSTSGNAETESA